jgi:hypothetical protein
MTTSSVDAKSCYSGVNKLPMNFNRITTFSTTSRKKRETENVNSLVKLKELESDCSKHKIQTIQSKKMVKNT